MKVKQQFTALAAALLTLSMLTACGGNNVGSAAGSSSKGSASTTSSASSSMTSASSSATSSGAASSSATADVVIPSRGTWSDNTYTNASIGLSFTNPKGWTTMTDDQIAIQIGKTKQTTSDNGTATQNIYDNITYDFFTFDPTTNNSIMLSYEDLAGTIGTVDATEKMYFENLNTLLINTGLYDKDSFSEITEVTVGGQTFQQESVSGESLGQKMNSTYLIRKQGGYMIVIYSIIYNDTSVADILKNFTAAS